MSSKHPYSKLAPYCFWRTAVSDVAPFDLDPLVRVPFQISQSDKVATAGSCFSQHIARRLRSSGFNYYVAESAPENLAPPDAERRNYGIFSARYGNIYTSSQLLQLFDRAFGLLKPELPTGGVETENM